MRTYKIQLISRTNSMVVNLATIPIFFISFFVFDIPSHEWRLYVVMAIVYTLAFLTHLKFVVGKTVWGLDNEGITITWTKKIPFADCKNLHLTWAQIKLIRTSVSMRSHQIIIFLSDGNYIKFYHNEMVRKDDLGMLIDTIDGYTTT